MKGKRKLVSLLVVMMVLMTFTFSLSGFAGDSQPAADPSQATTQSVAAETVSEKPADAETEQSAEAASEAPKTTEVETPAEETKAAETAKTSEESKAAETEKAAEKTETTSSTEQKLVNQEVKASIYTDGKYSEKSKDETSITISGDLPEGAIVKAYPVSVGIENKAILAAYDITIFDAEGKEFQPEANPVEVKISNPSVKRAIKEDETITAFHMKDAKADPEKLDKTNVSIEQNDTVQIQAKSFSIYVVTAPTTISVLSISPSTGSTNTTSGMSTESGDMTSKAFVMVGSTLQLTSNEEGSNDRWTVSNSSYATISGDGKTATLTGVGVDANNPYTAQTVTVTHTYYAGYRDGWQWETLTVYVIPRTIKANVYYTYSNAVPSNLNTNYVAGDFGPAGNDVPAITFDVDLSELGVTPVIGNGGFVYYSDQGSNTSYSGDGYKTYWNTIKQGISDTGIAALNTMFGEGEYIGYVLKKEGQANYHLDGVFKTAPPIYYVELYDSSNDLKFTLNRHPENTTSKDYEYNRNDGVQYATFKTRLQTFLTSELGASDVTFKEENTDKIVVEYTSNSEHYKMTITPANGMRTNITGEDYAVYPGQVPNSTDRGVFEYGTRKEHISYVSRLKYEITREVIVDKEWQDENGTKMNTAPDGASVTFTLYSNGARTENTVTLNGTADSEADHPNNRESESWKAKFENLPAYSNGKKITYTVQETGTYDGYDAVYPNNETSAKDGQTIINKKRTLQLTIKKVIDGDYADKTKTFTINYKIGNQEQSVELGDNETSNVITVPYGSQVTVSEPKTNGYTASMTSTAEAGTYDSQNCEYVIDSMTADTLVTVTNESDPITPTSLTTDNDKWILGAGVIGLIALLGLGLYFFEHRARRRYKH